MGKLYKNYSCLLAALYVTMSVGWAVGVSFINKFYMQYYTVMSSDSIVYVMQYSYINVLFGCLCNVWVLIQCWGVDALFGC